MRFSNFFMTDKDDKKEESLDNILLYNNDLYQKRDKEEEKFSKKIISTCMAYYIFISIVGIYLFDYFKMDTSKIQFFHYILITCGATILSLFASFFILTYAPLARIPFSKKLCKIKNKINDREKFILEILKTKKFQKELMITLINLEKSKNLSNQQQIYVKQVMINMADKLQQDDLENAMETLREETSLLSMLLEIDKNGIQKEEELHHYLKQFNDIEENNILPAQMSYTKGKIDYRSVV